jgi:hypothetical protein
MPAAKKNPRKAAGSKPAAARAERKKASKTVDFRGLTITLKSKIPGSIIFDLADLEGGKDLVGMMGILKSLIGENQFRAVRQKIDEDEVDFEEIESVLIELFESIFEAAGLSLGES